MISDAVPDTPAGRLVQLPDQSRRVSTRRARFTWLLATIWGLSLGLVVFNGWWYWRDTRPLADLRTIGTWIAQEHFAEAEPVLREHVGARPTMVRLGQCWPRFLVHGETYLAVRGNFMRYPTGGLPRLKHSFTRARLI